MKTSLARLCIAILLSIVAVIGYSSGYAALSRESAKVAKLDVDIRTKSDTVTRIAATRLALAGVANDEATVRSYFVLEDGVVAFIDSLEKQGKSLGATIRVRSVEAGGVPGQSTIELSLIVSGTFDSVMRAVGSMEYLPYNLSVSSLALTQDGKKSWHADVTLSVGTLPATRDAASSPAGSSTFAAPSPLSYANF